MKDVADIRTTRIYVFDQDNLPFAFLGTQPSLAYIKEQLNFRNVITTEEGAIDFSNGAHVVGAAQVPIDRLVIEPRRFTLILTGDSISAEKVYEHLIGCVKLIQPAFSPTLTVMTEQTSCVVTLDVPFVSIFDKRFVNFINRDVVKASPLKGKKTSPEFRSLRIALRYYDEDPANPTVPVTTKDFVIEPRAEVPQSENRYFTVSPNDTGTHIQLIEAFEAAMKGISK